MSLVAISLPAHAVGVADIHPSVFLAGIFVLACFVGYYVVWSVTPALHTPLMSVTNAISAVVVVGAIIAAAATAAGAAAASNDVWVARWLGAGAVFLASVNIFGGFLVTRRMLAMYKKKER
ncbi:proton-translocating transhydrogenase family protein [Hyphomonas sp. FCG-A18]|jgi:NAD(P) transhydrogenase subunit alpha|uniref:proton-translocating transhydrogenase family protein n=1 Tax=Hyphomonas sp. FCG-A18 TaxID=3080019 RepID=UPI002B320E66|nr:proton-translocating transhydrogenase family protein [Hyphomonas sp. FCG-A18]